MTADCDVLIAGAGPTGMAAALVLAGHGHTVRLIDKHEHGLGYSRAILVNPATLDRLEPTGAAALIRARGRVVSSIALYGPRGPILSGNVNRPGDPAAIALPQLETERCLAECLAQRGVTAERPCALQDAVQDADGVTCTLVAPGGLTEIRAKYLIGADGFHSVARGILGLPFPAISNPTQMYGVDAIMDWPYESFACVFLLDEGAVFAIDLGDRLVRFAATHETAFLALGLSGKIERKGWESRFDVVFGQVPRYGAGRIWLAGDAAHVHSPVGGRGMNMGIADGLRLADAIHAGDPSRYEAERHPVAASWVAQNQRLTRLASRRDGLGRAARHAVRLALTAFGELSGETAARALFGRVALGPT